MSFNTKIIKEKRLDDEVIDVREKLLIYHQNPKRGGKNKNGKESKEEKKIEFLSSS